MNLWSLPICMKKHVFGFGYCQMSVLICLLYCLCMNLFGGRKCHWDRVKVSYNNFVDKRHTIYLATSWNKNKHTDWEQNDDDDENIYAVVRTLARFLLDPASCSATLFISECFVLYNQFYRAHQTKHQPKFTIVK